MPFNERVVCTKASPASRCCEQQHRKGGEGKPTKRESQKIDLENRESIERCIGVYENAKEKKLGFKPIFQILSLTGWMVGRWEEEKCGQGFGAGLQV